MATRAVAAVLDALAVRMRTGQRSGASSRRPARTPSFGTGASQAYARYRGVCLAAVAGTVARLRFSCNRRLNPVDQGPHVKEPPLGRMFQQESFTLCGGLATKCSPHSQPRDQEKCTENTDRTEWR